MTFKIPAPGAYNSETINQIKTLIIDLEQNISIYKKKANTSKADIILKRAQGTLENIITKAIEGVPRERKAKGPVYEFLTLNEDYLNELYKSKFMTDAVKNRVDEELAKYKKNQPEEERSKHSSPPTPESKKQKEKESKRKSSEYKRDSEESKNQQNRHEFAKKKKISKEAQEKMDLLIKQMIIDFENQLEEYKRVIKTLSKSENHEDYKDLVEEIKILGLKIASIINIAHENINGKSNYRELVRQVQDLKECTSKVINDSDYKNVIEKHHIAKDFLSNLFQIAKVFLTSIAGDLFSCFFPDQKTALNNSAKKSHAYASQLKVNLDNMQNDRQSKIPKNNTTQ